MLHCLVVTLYGVPCVCVYTSDDKEVFSSPFLFRKDCCGVYIMDENRLNKPYNVLQ